MGKCIRLLISENTVKFLRILAEFFLLNDFETAKNVSLLLNIKIWYIISVYIELVIKQFS